MVQVETGALVGRNAWLFRAHKRYEMALLKNVSYDDLATKLGMHEQTVGEYLRGTTAVPDGIINRMIALLATAGVDEFPLP